MVEPAELLEDLCMGRRVIKDTLIRGLGAVELKKCQVGTGRRGKRTYVFLLLVNMSDLEPNVLLRKGTRGRADNVLEALLRVRYDLCRLRVG